MKRLMVDCETLDVGERPVLLSIGAVVFDDYEIHNYFHVTIDIENAKSHGFSVSQDTVDWWDRQDPAARAVAFNGICHIKLALVALVNFYKIYGCNEIWSKGALADIRWINNALDYFNISKPWPYYREMCFRTFLKMVPKFDLPFSGTRHNALSDATYQAEQFIYAKQLLQQPAQALQEKSKDFNVLAQKVAAFEFKRLQEETV